MAEEQVAKAREIGVSENIVILDAGGNPGAERIYGYKAEEIVGRPISVLVPPELPDELRQILERRRHGGNLEHYETTRVQKDGSRIEVSVIARSARHFRAQSP